MSIDPFPEHLDAVRLFARTGSVGGLLPVSRLERFVSYLVNSAGEIQVELHFGHDEEQRQVLSGNLHCAVNVVCQRCMQPMALQIESSLRLLVLESEDAIAALHGSDTILDAIIMAPDGLDVLAVLEDELILSLPLVPLHDEASCNEALNDIRAVPVAEVKESRTSPFAVLATLKPAVDGQNKE